MCITLDGNVNMLNAEHVNANEVESVKVRMSERRERGESFWNILTDVETEPSGDEMLWLDAVFFPPLPLFLFKNKGHRFECYLLWRTCLTFSLYCPLGFQWSFTTERRAATNHQIRETKKNIKHTPKLSGEIRKKCLVSSPVRLDYKQKRRLASSKP